MVILRDKHSSLCIIKSVNDAVKSFIAFCKEATRQEKENFGQDCDQIWQLNLGSLGLSYKRFFMV